MYCKLEFKRRYLKTNKQTKTNKQKKTNKTKKTKQKQKQNKTTTKKLILFPIKVKELCEPIIVFAKKEIK